VSYTFDVFICEAGIQVASGINNTQHIQNKGDTTSTAFAFTQSSQNCGLSFTYSVEYFDSASNSIAKPSWLTYDAPNKRFTAASAVPIGELGTYHVKVKAELPQHTDSTRTTLLSQSFQFALTVVH